MRLSCIGSYRLMAMEPLKATVIHGVTGALLQWLRHVGEEPSEWSGLSNSRRTGPERTRVLNGVTQLVCG